MRVNFSHQKVFNFRHWTRKSYAIFQSLKLQIRIATISIAIILIPIHKLVAQEAQVHHHGVGEYDLDTVEVMGELTPELAKDLSRPIQVVNVRSISHLPISSLQSILNSSSQLDIRRRGPQDIQADISIRASGFDQVQILLNGYDVTDPQTGHHSLNIPIVFSQLRQVQILSGAGTRSLGVNAFAGAVNFVTQQPDSNFIDIETKVGSFGFTDFSIAVGQRKNIVSNYIFANRSSSSGYTTNTDFMRYSVFYNGKIGSGKSNLDWQFSFMNKAFGANNFYTPKYPNQFEQLRTAFGGIRFRTKGKVFTTTSIHYRANADRFELFRHGMDVPSWYKNHNYHLSQVIHVSSKAWTWSRFGKTSMAINYRSESILSNVLGVPMSKKINAVFDINGFYDKRAQRSYVSFSMEHTYIWHNLKIAGGFMYNNYFESRTKGGVYPGIDVTYSLNNSSKFFGGINTGMRLPTFSDLYYSGPSNIGNPDLFAEQQTSYQVGYIFNKKLIKFKANIFDNMASNSIDWVRESDTVKWQPINITDVQTVGFDCGISLYPVFFKRPIFNYINEFSINWAYNYKTTSSHSYQSHYVLDYLRNKVVVTLNHKLFRGFSLAYIYRFEERMGQYLKYDAVNDISEPVRYMPYSLFDIKLFWNYAGWKLYLSSSNVLNVMYNDYGNVQQAGRWFTIGVTKRIGL